MKLKITLKTLLFIMLLIARALSKRLWEDGTTLQTLEELAIEYEDERNAMIATRAEDEISIYDDFYEEMDNRIEVGQSMNMIFFGPASSFLRIDTETLLHILSFTKKHKIPITRAILAWDMVTDGKTAAFLQGREYLAFGTLINVIPEEDLHYVNFGDPSVLKYFSHLNIGLEPRKMGILISAYKRYYGNQWHTKAMYINELGYLLCGFPASDLARISANVFKDITTETLMKMKKCSRGQFNAMYKIAISPEAYGIPYTWTDHEIGHLGQLFNCIPEEEIKELQLDATSAITPEVMIQIDNRKLPYFTKQQILNMKPKTRRIYILRMQLRTSYDMENISAGSEIMKTYNLFNFIFWFYLIFLDID